MAPLLPSVDQVARGYLEQAGGDPELALRDAIADALGDYVENDRKLRFQERLISRGFVRWPPASRDDIAQAGEAL
jgi:hypothetical protein